GVRAGGQVVCEVSHAFVVELAPDPVPRRVVVGRIVALFSVLRGRRERGVDGFETRRQPVFDSDLVVILFGGHGDPDAQELAQGGGRDRFAAGRVEQLAGHGETVIHRSLGSDLVRPAQTRRVAN